MKNKNEISINEQETKKQFNLNIRFKILNNNKNILDTTNFPKFYNNQNNNQNLNKSKSTKEFSMINSSSKSSVSYRCKKNEILLLEQKRKKAPNFPICLSYMTNKKNLANYFKNKCKNINKINANNNNGLYKSNSTGNASRSIKFDIYNLKNIKINNNNESIKLNKNINNTKLILKLSKMNEAARSARNLNTIKNIVKKENVLIENKYLYDKKLRNHNIILNNIGTLNSILTSNTLDIVNSTIFQNQNISQHQQFTSSIQNPHENTTNKLIINPSKLNREHNSSNINEFLTKDTNDKKIKKILSISLKHNQFQTKYDNINNINKKPIKKEIHKYPTISVEEEKNKNKSNKHIHMLCSNIKKNKIINNDSKRKDNNSKTSNNTIMSYLFKNKNVIESSSKYINSIKEETIKLNKLINNVKGEKTQNNTVSVNENNDKNNKKNNNEKKKKKSITNNANLKNVYNNYKKEIHKNKEEKISIIDNNKFLVIFNPKKNEEKYSINKFLYFYYSDINEKNENINTNTKKNKASILIKEKREINNFILKKEAQLKEYKQNIENNLTNLKKRIIKEERKIIKKESKKDKIKNKIIYMKRLFLYNLQFKNFNLASLSSNYIFKSIHFSSLYLPLVKRKNNQRRPIVPDGSNFLKALSNSLYPDIKMNYIKSIKPEKRKNFLNNTQLIIRLTNLDIDQEDISDSEDTINKNEKRWSVGQMIYINKFRLKKRKALKHKVDLSFIPQFYNDDNNTTYKKICPRGSFVTYTNIIKKKKYFSHSLLDEKEFFEVPKRSFNVKLNSALSNRIAYYKISDRKIEELKNDQNEIIDDMTNNEKNIEELIFKKCIEKLKASIHRSNISNGNKQLGNNYCILREIKGKEYIEETLRILIKEGEEKLFLDYLRNNLRYIDINCRDEDNNTFLILSAREGLEKVVKRLLDSNAEVDLQNNNGNTALHYALGNKLFYIADILKRYGADESKLNKNGLTPWECVGNFTITKNN